MTPRVSVLMTVYNGLPYLRHAIESVLEQTWTDFEFVIVDDASTDGSAACIEAYRDARIRLIRNAVNRGQGWSLRHGLEQCRGAYVARLDQDDACLPARLRRQAALLDGRPDVTVVGALLIAVDTRGQRVGLLGRRIDDYGMLVASLLLGLCPVCHPSVMFRRERVLAAGGYDAACAPAEDVELWTRVALARQGITVIPEALGYSRVHPGQQSHTKAPVQQQRMWQAQRKLLEAYCSATALECLALFLQKDPAFLQGGMRTAWRQVLTALHELMEHAGLSAQERRGFLRVMDRHVGLAVRVGPRLAAWPPGAFHLAVGLLSPMCVPGMRPMLSRIARAGRHAAGPSVARRALSHSGGPL